VYGPRDNSDGGPPNVDIASLRWSLIITNCLGTSIPDGSTKRSKGAPASNEISVDDRTRVSQASADGRGIAAELDRTPGARHFVVTNFIAVAGSELKEVVVAPAADTPCAKQRTHMAVTRADLQDRTANVNVW
jgi:hypothetical protein